MYRLNALTDELKDLDFLSENGYDTNVNANDSITNDDGKEQKEGHEEREKEGRQDEHTELEEIEEMKTETLNSKRKSFNVNMKRCKTTVR